MSLNKVQFGHNTIIKCCQNIELVRNHIKFGPLVLEMAFKNSWNSTLILNSGGHFVQWSKRTCANLKEDIMTSICVTIFWICVSGTGYDHMENPCLIYILINQDYNGFLFLFDFPTCYWYLHWLISYHSLLYCKAVVLQSLYLETIWCGLPWDDSLKYN